ncbi:putative manganese-dependent inorganic diphosphatase [Caloramator sp. CAR-1]|jgi:manganese-dependent inorganic pyrophosphatase|uniref:putative manganese-dependent inorganic diphosphatase n=1 Tax=Caloramator sp. CAR-1 TaxID=3062777 RepID=UPI0026E2BE46|nr:putative manganese-dependent inorganic diphosphatase [Caloramator sp. CAR-1]MDO6354441.1 putative manganese-dependent inorganic diphosphatase [Caloramator sp. CAR-1]
MTDIIYIFGHKNPDTDSISAAIAYAELKKRLGFNAIAKRLGDINQETDFVLNYFNIPKPDILPTVKTQVSDLNLDKVIPISPDSSIKTAWMLMKKNNVKTLAVIDENEKFLGLVTLSNITSKYMDTLENNIIKTPLRNILETLNAKIILGDEAKFNSNGKIVVAALSPESMKPFIEKGDIVIIGNRKDSQKKAIELGANCLIITGGFSAEDEILELAKQNNCIIINTPNDTYTTARLINQSIPVKYVMTTENIISFHIDDFVDEIRDKMLQTRYRSYPVLDENNKIYGFISRYHLISQKKKQVILVDHNERSQTVHGIDDAEILEIIDHHRVADIQTGKPIFFRNEPVGSTSTIIAGMYFENGIRPPKNIAGLLCAAIISDTVKFKSPTCTYIDKITAERLAEIAGIDIEGFALEMFRAGTSLQNRTPEEIFFQDFKEFKLGKYKIGISQVNTMNVESLGETKNDLLNFMNKLCNEKGYDLLIIMLTDIIREGSEIIFTGKEKDLIAKAFNVDVHNNFVFLPGVISRKKQIIPPLSQIIE